MIRQNSSVLKSARSLLSDRINGVDRIDFSNQEEEKQKNKWEVLRVKANHFLEHTIFGQFYVNLLLLISVLSAFEFIYQTYLDPVTIINCGNYNTATIADSTPDPFSPTEMPTAFPTHPDINHNKLAVLNKLEFAIASLFLLDWFLALFVAEHKLTYLNR